ncbi:MAG: hypothetical protein AMXMBFR12_08100 [Candidatus Babeliales bacterium]
MNINYLLFSFVISFATTYCIDADIFKEMLTFGTSVEAQEHPLQEEIINHCALIAILKCRTQLHSLQKAAKNELESKANEVRKCVGLCSNA